MKLKADMFPYPVLNSELDDFSTGNFSVNIEKNTISVTKISLVFDFKLDNPDIQNLINENKAKFAIHLEGISSVYRKLIFLENYETFKEIFLDVGTVPKKVQANFMIISTQTIINYQNRAFNPEYYGENFSIPIIEKGSILAFDNMAEINIDFENFEQNDIKSIIRVASKKQQFMDVDIDGDVIQVNLPEKSYFSYVNLSKSNQVKQKLLMTTIILPALTMVIEKVRLGEVESTLKWYDSLEKLLSKIGYSLDDFIGSSEDSMNIAQQLLDYPLLTALSDFYEMDEVDN
ncbi:hypothetical protein [Streptococcus uberis]|uniref:hypothetical protein n=1 Tax=Streptococcus uberis TaxID=1349 RepID=UPI0019393E0A|nr:hypothetical protein [Streptococcus uberis]